MKMMIVAILVGAVRITSYQSLHNQTDSSPNWTSIGEHVHSGGIAVSADLLCPLAKIPTKSGFVLCNRGVLCPHPEMLHYHDYLFVDGFGIRQVNDRMGLSQWDDIHKKRVPINKAIDLWVQNYDEEKAVGVKRGKIWLIKDK